MNEPTIFWVRYVENVGIVVHGRLLTDKPYIAEQATLNGIPLKLSEKRILPTGKCRDDVQMWDLPEGTPDGEHVIEIITRTGNVSAKFTINRVVEESDFTEVAPGEYLVTKGRLKDKKIEGKLTVKGEGVVLENVHIVNKEFNAPALLMWGCSDLFCYDCYFRADRPIDGMQHKFSPRVTFSRCEMESWGTQRGAPGRFLGEDGAMLFCTGHNMNRSLTLAGRQGPLKNLLIYGNSFFDLGRSDWRNESDGMCLESVGDAVQGTSLGNVIVLDPKTCGKLDSEPHNVYAPGFIVVHKESETYAIIKKIGMRTDSQLWIELETPLPKLPQGTTFYIGSSFLNMTIARNHINGGRFGVTLWGVFYGLHLIDNLIDNCTVPVQELVRARPEHPGCNLKMVTRDNLIFNHALVMVNQKDRLNYGDAPIWTTPGGYDFAKLDPQKFVKF